MRVTVNVRLRLLTLRPVIVYLIEADFRAKNFYNTDFARQVEVQEVDDRAILIYILQPNVEFLEFFLPKECHQSIQLVKRPRLINIDHF